MANRTTQVASFLESSGSPIAQTTQVAAMLESSGSANARATQVAAFLESSGSAKIRTTQVAAFLTSQLTAPPHFGTAATIQHEQNSSISGNFLGPPPMPNPSPPWPTPISKIIPAYPYQQYQDDPNIVAFFVAYNTLAQSYLDWFNQTPFGVYTSPHVNGQLLDWIGQGIYGVPRPVFSTLAKHYIVANLDGVPLDTIDIDGSDFFETGTAVTASDDFYKRTITWLTYLGDGRMCNANVIRKRVARFLYGVNGADITASQAQSVSVEVITSPSISYAIAVPVTANPASTYFQDAFASGILSFPFQLAATVSIV